MLRRTLYGTRLAVAAMMLICLLSNLQAGSSIEPAYPLSGAGAGIKMIVNGRPVGVVVVAEGADEFVYEAAKIFVDTVQRATSAHLPIMGEAEAAQLGDEVSRLYVGVAAGGLDAGSLPPETYRILSKANAVYVIGNDSRSDDSLPIKTVSRPTLWALNSILEKELGVRWLWPGQLGTYVPNAKSFSIRQQDTTYQPQLQMRILRLNISSRRPLVVGDSELNERLTDEARLWSENHQVGQRGGLRFGHAFGHWWEKYSEQHPDYFAELPEQYPMPFPLPGRAKLRLANPAVIDQIVSEYIAAGKPKYWNVCPNDGAGFDTSAQTRAWDIPQNQPIDAIISGRANLTARYVEFWNRLYPRLAELNPDVILTTYAYSAYRYPPPAERPLTAKAIFQIVDTYTAHGYANWLSWAEFSFGMVLRPNWWHQGADAPYLPLQKTSDYIKFAFENKMMGMDMDSVIGYWATQGINYYLTARLMTQPDLPVEVVIEEYTAAFGAGAKKIREYLAYWENLTNTYNYPLNAAHEPENEPSRYADLVKKGKVSASILSGSKYALPYLYGEEVLVPAEQILDEAVEAIGDSDAEAVLRVAFLRSGLQSLRATRDQLTLGQRLKETPSEALEKEFEVGSSNLDDLRQSLAADHAIWPAAIKRHEDRYKVLIRPENIAHHMINLDGL